MTETMERPEVAAETAVTTWTMADATSAPSLAPLVDMAKAVALAAGKDASLPILMDVYMDWDGFTLTLAATDRYTLHVAEWIPEPADAPQGGPFTLHLPAKQLLDALKVKKCATFTVKDGALSVNDWDGNVRTVAHHDGEFPKFRALIPEQCEGVAGPFYVDPAKLAVSAKACMLAGGKNVPVLFTQHDTNRPIRYTPQSTPDRWSFTGLIMPVRVTS